MLNVTSLEAQQQSCSRYVPVVAQIVDEVTDDKSLAKQVRKELQASNALRLSIGALGVKPADEIPELVDVLRSPPPGGLRTVPRV